MSRALRPRARVGLTLATVLCLLVGAYGLAIAASGFAFLAEGIAANGMLLALEVHIVAASAPWCWCPGSCGRCCADGCRGCTGGPAARTSWPPRSAG